MHETLNHRIITCDLIFQNEYTYIHIYIYVCVCVCAHGAMVIIIGNECSKASSNPLWGYLHFK